MCVKASHLNMKHIVWSSL